MLLHTPEEIHSMLETFDVTGEDGMDEFFRSHNVDPVGVIHYGAILARAAAFSKATDDPVTALLTLFAGGVALGLKLAEMSAKNGEVVDLDSRR